MLVKVVFCLSHVFLHAHSVERGAFSQREEIRIRNIGREVHKSSLDVRVEAGSRVQKNIATVYRGENATSVFFRLLKHVRLSFGGGGETKSLQ